MYRSDPTGIHLESASRSNSTTALTTQIKQELKAAKVAIIMILAFSITWMPFIHLRSTEKYLPERLVGEGTAFMTAERVTLVMFTCSTFINPLVYSLLNREFQAEVRRILSRMCFTRQ